MNKLYITVHVPESTGVAPFSREGILNSKFLNNDQKQLLMERFHPTETLTWINGDKYFKVGEGKKVTVSTTDVYYCPKKDKYAAVERDETVGYFNDYKTKTVVAKDNTKFKLW